MADETENKNEEEVKEPAAEAAAPEASEEKVVTPAPAAEEATEEKPAAPDAPAAPAAAEEKKPAAPAAEEKKEEKPRTAADVLQELDPDSDDKNKVVKAKGSKNIHSGIVHVKATFNNTMVTVTDPNGNTIGWSTSGKMGFRGSRKSTAYAAQIVCQDACRQAMSHGFKEAEVRVKGPGSGRESAVRAVQGLGIEVTTIRDVTSMPHNGCRPPKARRV
ncbi:MAG: small subunit ribosomal protein S11 [Verrucomicrobiales bacterium]|jgi:small subunit ribosomal protein S11